MTDKILMPKELTAENGTKGLLSGEFFVTVHDECIYCAGTGTLDAHGHEVCDECNGQASYERRITIGWYTIKEIYAMAVKHFGSPQEASK
jgi:DnaJ-class molecular chaperone